jgi:hypothetical protein
MEKTIYALIDPRTEQVRYVGATVNLSRRVGEHLYRRNESHCSRWIHALKDAGLRPCVWVLAVIEGDWASIERHWIDLWRGLGDLTNIMDGGQGASAGVPKSLSTRRKMSEAATKWQTGRKIGAAHRASMSVERKKRYEDPDYYEREAERMRKLAPLGGRAGGGDHMTEEHRAAASERMKQLNAERWLQVA